MARNRGMKFPTVDQAARVGFSGTRVEAILDKVKRRQWCLELARGCSVPGETEETTLSRAIAFEKWITA